MAFAYTFYFSSFLISLINPFWGLVGLVVSVLIRFQDRFPEIASIKPFSLLFLGMIIGCVINKDKLSQHNWDQDRLLIWMLVVSMLGLLVMSPGDIIFETWEFICSLAFYFFASRILQERRQFIIIFAVMSSCIVYMGYEAIQDVLLHPLTSVFIDQRNERWQGIGYYSNANEFGQLMITTIPFLLAAIIMKNNILIKITAVIFIAVLVYVVGETQSRTVMVLLGVMVILTFILRKGGNIIKKVIRGSILVMVLFTALQFAPSAIQDRLGTLTNIGDDKSFEGRTRSWGYGFDMLSWYPVTGVGKGRWLDYHGLSSHNSYVQIMAELGPAGIFLFLAVLRLSFYQFRPFYLEKDDLTEGEKKAEEQHPVWGNQEVKEAEEAKEVKEAKENSAILENQYLDIDPETKTVVIAITVVYVAWLVYIFLGNQGYSVWTYFYIGLCAAVKNLLPEKSTT